MKEVVELYVNDYGFIGLSRLTLHTETDYIRILHIVPIFSFLLSHPHQKFGMVYLQTVILEDITSIYRRTIYGYSNMQDMPELKE